MNVMWSIIIAVYNCNSYIGRCIDSAVNQKSKSFEIIIVDDGSTDGTSDICDCYINNYNVKVIHQPNKGHTAARLRGIEAANGDYICIIDADDWLEPSFLSSLESILNNSDKMPDVISYNYNKIDPQNDKQSIVSKIPSGYYNKQQLIENVYPIMLSDQKEPFFSFGIFPTLWSKVFRKDIIYNTMQMLDTNIVLGEDVFCVYYSLYNANSMIILDDCLYNYFINSNSLTRQYAEKNFEKLTVLCELMDKVYPEELREQIRRYKLNMLLGAITNETRGPLRINEIVFELCRSCELDTFDDCIKNTIVIKCPLYKRVMWIMLKLKMYWPLVVLLRLIKA